MNLQDKIERALTLIAIAQAEAEKKDEEIKRLQNLVDLKSFQVEVLEHNIDLLDSNYQYLLNELDCDEYDRLVNGCLLKLPESLKPSIEFPEFKIIAADEGQDLSHTQININAIPKP